MQWQIETYRNLSWPDLLGLEEQTIKKVQETDRLGILLFLETQPTLTYGKSALKSDLLEKTSIPQYPAPRGGKWTYHGPGQVLIFPIFHLKDLGYSNRDVRAFLCDFQKNIITTLKALEIDAQRREDRPFGLYAEGKKICSFGISVKRGLVSHGAALYLQPQHLGFSKIHPCGVIGEEIGHLQQWLPSLNWENLASQLVETFKKKFQIPPGMSIIGPLI